jgi:hypothetical protein
MNTDAGAVLFYSICNPRCQINQTNYPPIPFQKPGRTVKTSRNPTGISFKNKKFPRLENCLE